MRFTTLIYLIIIVPLLLSCGNLQEETSGQLPATTKASDQTPETAEKPNIIFFLVDDLGWTDVGCFGSAFYETPNIDALAKQGVKFTNAYAACHVCSPTRASILTGKYPATLQLTDWLGGRRDTPFQELLNAEKYQHLPYRETSIAEALKDVGYNTAILGKWHLGEDPSDPTAHGFDMHLPDWAKGWPKNGYFAPFELKGFEDSEEGDYLTDRLTEEALKYIEQNKSNPFFLYLSHYAVHDPIQGRKDLVEKYKKKLLNQPPPEGPDFILEGNPDNPTNPSQEAVAAFTKSPEFLNPYTTYPNDLALVKQKQDNVEFAGMVESMDESLGRIMKKLEELGLNDNTIIFFYSDNGGMAAMNGTPKRKLTKEQLDIAYSTANLPLRGAKGWLYEGGIRVPLIVKYPKKGKQGIECSLPVTSVDMLPTILNMVNAPQFIRKDVEGIDLSPALQGEPMERGAIYWHFPHYSNHGMQSPGGAIREGDYKLLEYFENGTVQLFNLKEDIGEQHDLSKIEVEKTQELKDKLHRWREEVNASMMPSNPDYDPSTDLWSGK
ncbi:MAG: sulfatase [Saprospiraceae bacterium]|nr:sulfatase [Saprospiraceae bacterium]